MSERLLGALVEMEAKGFAYYPANVGIADESQQVASDWPIFANDLPVLYHLVITGRCDGPWVGANERGNTCATCGQARLVRKPNLDYGTVFARMVGDMPPQPRLVYPSTWNGEDFFELTEPGVPLVTARVVDLLRSTGNLRKEDVPNRAAIERLMPKYAETLERLDWQVEPCVGLGPAGWATGN